MKETCGMVHGSALCGKPAVEFVDIPTPSGGTLRLYLCADHYDLRDEIMDKHGSREDRIDRAIKRFEDERNG